ncbi:hypothetical protein [Streptomyces sp. NPDC057460]|uniref:hypothetical protein n=1 Tax=Streptomyces sp. NPDC057460 TaxID=3346141 RepID=UPI0036A79DAF
MDDAWPDGADPLTAIDLSCGDWTLPGDGTDPVFDNTVVARTDHRKESGGRGPTCVIATAPFSVPDGKRIKSVTLPDNANVYVFAVGLG